jgi:hypothetical protein
VLAVEGDVVVESAHVRIRLHGAGGTLTAHLDGGIATLPLLRRIRSFAPLARMLVPMFVRAGVTVDVFAGSLCVARAGAGVDANRIARMLDLANVRIGR